MVNNLIPSPALKAGRRALGELPGVVLLQDWRWDPDIQKWILHCRLTPGITPSTFLAAVTEWHIQVDPSYPWGAIKIYPDREHGPKSTFRHQLYNGNYGDKPWGSGEICVSTPLRVFGQRGLDIEPYGMHERLRWHIERTLEWLRAAAENNLVIDGEPFELPEFPMRQASKVKVAFKEGRDTYLFWHDLSDNVGLVELFDTTVAQNYIIVRAFLDNKKKMLLSSDWGNSLRSNEAKTYIGLWIRANTVPTLEPWQAPMNWGELRKCFLSQGINLDDQLKAIVRFIRDGLEHIILIGFPMADIQGEPPVQMHWQAIRIPVLAHGTLMAPGYRPNELGYWQCDRMDILANDKPLYWVPSENWHDDQMTSRGSLPHPVKESRFVIIGAGALGSAVADLLVRAGIRDLAIIDGEALEVKNLVRHNLIMTDVRQSKAERLAIKLNSISPNARVEAINSMFPPTEEKARQQIQNATVIIDCSGSDNVLDAMECFAWDSEKLFISLSLGMKAQRLFCFTMQGATVSHEKYRELMHPWLSKEIQENQEMKLPREGVGCWHPVFPARADCISLMAATAVKLIEEITLQGQLKPELIVFESYNSDNSFGGIKRIQ